MNNNGNPISIERNVTLATERILKKCEKLPTAEKKIAYLKKIISDCDRIINLAEKLDGKYLDVNLLKKTEQNIDENLILFLEELCKPTLSLPNGQAGLPTGGQEKIPLVLRQPRKYYKVSLTDGDKVCDIQIAFGGMKSFKESIKDQITVIETVEKNEEMTAINNIDTIKIKISFADIVRNFESMYEADWISTKTPIRKIAQIFFSEIPNQIKFVNNYYSTKEQLNKNTSSSSESEKAAKFIMLFAKKSLNNKRKELDEIINFLIKLRK